MLRSVRTLTFALGMVVLVPQVGSADSSPRSPQEDARLEELLAKPRADLTDEERREVTVLNFKGIQVSCGMGYLQEQQSKEVEQLREEYREAYSRSAQVMEVTTPPADTNGQPEVAVRTPGDSLDFIPLVAAATLAASAYGLWISLGRRNKPRVSVGEEPEAAATHETPA